MVYKHNFSGTPVLNRNINSLSVEDFKNLGVDCILMSPPCQPFTRVGLKKDSGDERCLSLLHILDLIPNLADLKYILVENVKGFEVSDARHKLVTCLDKCNFNYKEFILSPHQFGISNSRLRYYLIARRGSNLIFENNELIEFLPENVKLLLQNQDSCYEIRNILDDIVSEKYFLPRKVLEKRRNILDIRYPDSIGSCCFTKAYTHYIEGTGSVFCPYSKAIIENKFEKLRDKNCLDESELLDLMDLKIRYFTPSEVAKLMNFPKDFHFPKNLTDKQKYRLLGNSLNVHVVSQLIYLLNYGM